MKLKDLFPSLGDYSPKTCSNRNAHYTKKGPGRFRNKKASDRTEKEERNANRWLHKRSKFLRKILLNQAVHTN